MPASYATPAKPEKVERPTMAEQIKPIPDGYPTLIPYLSVRGGARAIEFYKQALGAVERVRMPGCDGDSVGHAELEIGDSLFMLSDESPNFGNPSPQTLNGTSVGLALYVEDVDAAFARAVDAGATVVQPLQDQFYGDRTGTVADPFGHKWTLMTHVEEVSPEEMQRRMAAESEKMAAAT
jgi:PhnB protein